MKDLACLTGRDLIEGHLAELVRVEVAADGLNGLADLVVGERMSVLVVFGRAAGGRVSPLEYMVLDEVTRLSLQQLVQIR